MDLSLQIAYTIKLVDPACKKDLTSVELGTARVYRSLASLQLFISNKLSMNPKFKLPDCGDGLC